MLYRPASNTKAKKALLREEASRKNPHLQKGTPQHLRL